MIQAKLANSFVNREYPALPNNEKNNSNAFYSKPMISKPEINRKYENTLKENINLFNLKLITAQELAVSCNEIIPKNDYNHAFILINQLITNQSIADNIKKQLEKLSGVKIQENNIKEKRNIVINLPPERKNKYYHK